MHDIKFMAEEIENQTQCHRTLIQHHAILHKKDAGVQHHFQLANKEILYVLSEPMIRWQETTVTVKKKEALPPFVIMNALLFSMQYGHVIFPCMLQPQTIS